jgi:hypothetical protein
MFGIKINAGERLCQIYLSTFSSQSLIRGQTICGMVRSHEAMLPPAAEAMAEVSAQSLPNASPAGWLLSLLIRHLADRD